ncbi:AP-4 complex accessory subunit RUSC2 isoform X2 [Myxocyprinus asiaticus]|nr:AP-4 complex accessory subunit RUSC2 isoform X2 [Myxocyprinus asiaticus]XP_051542279.1 AP-4 complex accessory subunit RUSC2 isoform X2 [Myxocyprinus asiaticus]
MDVSPKSGATLIVCHICPIYSQSVGWQLYNSVQAPRRPHTPNLTHSISLPERGDLPREALDYCSLSHNCMSSSTKTADRNSRGYESFPNLQRFFSLSENTPLTSPQRIKEPSHCRGTPRWQNIFIPESELIEDEEDEDSDGDNLHKYHEGSSLQLQGKFNLAQNMATGYSTEFSEPFTIKSKTGGSLFSQKILSCDMIPFSKAKEHKEQGSKSDSCCQDRRDSKGTLILMDCDEQDWGDEDYSKHTLEEPDNRCAQTENLLDCEFFAQNPTDYFTDSSCNSSDGVLVNFSAIYNKTNNAVPATPLNLDSPVHESGTMSQDDSNPIHSWSSHNVDPNCNIYPLDSDGFSSMENADLTMCLQSQARLTGSTQNYYKLVTCDLSSQSSPSPAWSSLTSFSETHSQGSCSPHSEYFLFGQSEGEEKERPKVDQCEHQGDGHIEVKNTRRATREQSKGTKERMAYAKTHYSATRVSEHDSCNYIKTPQSQSWIDSQKCSYLSKQGALQKSCPSHLDTDLASPIYRQHATSFAEIAQRKKVNGDSSSVKNSTEGPSGSHFIQKEDASDQNTVSFNPKHNKKMTEYSLSDDSGNQSNPEGACASSIEVVRYTKAQRPASLPIQPFVLQVPSGKQQSKALGSLLNQYISNKYSKPGPSKATCKSKGHSHHMPPSPLGSFSSIHLAATSSDSCSTCTSSPILPHGHPQCTQTSTLLGQIHQNLELMNRSPHMSPVRARSLESIEHTEESPKACARHTNPNQKYNWTGKKQASPLYNLPDQVPLVQITPAIRKELLATVPQYASDPSHQDSSPAISSVTSLTSITSLISLPSTEQRSLWPFEGASQVCTKEELDTNVHHFFGPKRSPCVMRECHHVDSSSMADRPHELFWLSPEATSEVLSLDLLHKRRMLKGVSLAVDLIIAHFRSRRDPEVKIRLENSSLCTSISQLVLKQLCPAIQNILQDGLKAYKLDLIIGQHRNKLWNVIEATARPGSSTRMPDSLLSVVKKCSQLSSNSMRLNVFIMDLLNLRALEFWIRHLYTCVDAVMEHYHQWGFLALAQGPTYRPLFQELLLLLQPLSLVPFDLHLPSEPHLQGKQKQKQRVPLPHLLLSQSAQILQMSLIQKNHKSPLGQGDISSKRVTDGHWLNQTPTTDCGIAVSCSESTLREEEEDTRMENSQMPGSSPRPQEDKSLGELHWARLFGSEVGIVVGSERAQKNLSGTLRSRRPSEWLKLGVSKVDLLAQSVWTGKWPETLLSGNHDKGTANEEHILNLKSL